ncbi:MAG: hypothetical protein AAGA56_26770, partial [Myxococcota bacterium]
MSGAGTGEEDGEGRGDRILLRPISSVPRGMKFFVERSTCGVGRCVSRTHAAVGVEALVKNEEWMMDKAWVRFLQGLLLVVVVSGGTLPPKSAHALQVGPDNWGLVASDELDPSLYTYFDLSLSPTSTQLIVDGDDDAATLMFPPGVTFNFYGVDYIGLRVAANGYLSTLPGDSGDDFSNDCPVAAPPGGGDRLYVLHDDYDAMDVYFEYFPTQNITIIQWTGAFWTDLGPEGSVNFQVFLYHDLGVAYSLIEEDTRLGAGSSQGAASTAQNTGLTLSCDTAGSVTPGVSQAAFGPLKLDAIRVDQPGPDVDEYFVVTGVPGFDASAMSVVVIGDDGSGDSGVIEEAVNLSSKLSARPVTNSTPGSVIPWAPTDNTVLPVEANVELRLTASSMTPESPEPS